MTQQKNKLELNVETIARTQDIQDVWNFHLFSYSGPYFSRIFPHSDYPVWMRENAGKMRTRITLNTDIFYAVMVKLKLYHF